MNVNLGRRWPDFPLVSGELPVLFPDPACGRSRILSETNIWEREEGATTQPELRRYMLRARIEKKRCGCRSVCRRELPDEGETGIYANSRVGAHFHWSGVRIGRMLLRSCVLDWIE